MWSFIISNQFTLYLDWAHNVKPLKHWLFPHNSSHSPKVILCLVFYTAVSHIFGQCSHQLCDSGRAGWLYPCLPYSETPLHKKPSMAFCRPAPELLPPIPVRCILPKSSSSGKPSPFTSSRQLQGSHFPASCKPEQWPGTPVSCKSEVH